MKYAKRMLAILMAVALFGTSVDFQVLARESQIKEASQPKQQSEMVMEEVPVVKGTLTEQDQDLPDSGRKEEVSLLRQETDEGLTTDSQKPEEGEIIFREEVRTEPQATYTTVPLEEDDMFSSSVENGVVDLIDGTATAWIDRIDLSEAEIIREFYDALIEASDNDGVGDKLIEDAYFTQGAFIPVGDVTGTVAKPDELSNTLNTVMNQYAPYIRAAFDAFDRDHPEVFWLSGITSSGATMTAGYNSSGGVDYTVSLMFYLKSDTMDVRDAEYQGENLIKDAILARDAKVTQLVGEVKGKTVTETIDYFNDYLTRSNQYNTSSNLNNIGHDCRECVSALEGRIGTDGPVCEAYARAFKVLCDKVGIPCVLVDGKARNSASSAGEGHMWNYVEVEGKWYGIDVTWNDPSVRGSTSAVSGYETDSWSLVGSQTVVGSGGLKFIESHPVENRASNGGVGFVNGPALEENKYVEGVSIYGMRVDEGECGSGNWAVYDSTADENTAVLNVDTLVISGPGAMADYQSAGQTPWNSYGSRIKKIIVLDGVTTIGDYAFDNLVNVTTVTMPQTLTKVGAYAFRNLTKAEGILVPGSLTQLGEGAYYHCQKLANFEIPAGLTTIPANAFGNCILLSRMVIPATIQSIGANAFTGTGLTTVYVPKRQNAITGTEAFAGLSNAKIYFESTPITQFENVTLKSPYTVSYRKNGSLTTIAQVYADDLQSYTLKEGDLPSTVGKWYITQGQELKAGTVLDKISSDIVICLHPFKITKHPENVELTYGRNTTQSLSVNLTKDSNVQITYQWYQNNTPVSGATAQTMTIPNGLAVGSYTYKVKITYEGISEYSNEATVTVAPADLSAATVEVSGQFVYDTTAQTPAASQIKVTLDGKTVSQEEYEITGCQNNINAGTATVTIRAKANGNYTGTATGSFLIQPMAIAMETVQLEAKTYDGTRTAEVTAVSFVKEGSTQAVSLRKDTDYRVTLANFKDADAGTEKEVTVQIALSGQATDNYRLVQAQKTVTNGVISKATAPATTPVTKKYVYSKKHEVSLDMSQWLPALESGRSYGDITYSATQTQGSLLEAAPVVKNNILEYVVKEGVGGATGTITITVNAKNYAPFNITLNLQLDNLARVTLADGSGVSLRNNRITYGEDLSHLIFNEAVFVEEGTGKTVAGTLTWVNPTQVLKAGMRKASWIFTPADSQYMAVEGEIEVLVDKAQGTVAAVSNGYNTVYEYNGNTLSQPLPNDFTYSNTDAQAQMTFAWYSGEYSYNETLAESDKLSQPPVEAGIYTLVATVEETDNFLAASTRCRVQINKKKLILTLENKTRRYGEENPEFTFTITQGSLAGSDRKEDLIVHSNTLADSSSPVGTYEITGTGESKNYEITVLPGTLTIEKALGMLTLPEGKTEYTKRFGDGDFEILTESNGKESLIYTVSEGKSLEGNTKNEEDILVVDASGMATICGSGTVKVEISLPETENHTAAGPVSVSVLVHRMDGFVVEVIPDQTYTGKAIRPEPKVFDGENETFLIKGKDYVLSYKNNVNAGEPEDGASAPMVIVKGKGNYTKQMEVPFTILPKDIGEEEVLVDDLYLLTNGKVQKKMPTVTYNKRKLKNGKDMLVTYLIEDEGSFRAPGEHSIVIYGEGNYSGQRQVKLILQDKGYLLNKASVKKIPDQYLSRYEDAIVIDPDTLVVTMADKGKKVTLVPGEDFVVESYENHDRVGTATMTLRGINRYSGIKEVNFKIKGTSLSDTQISDIPTQTYQGTAIEPEMIISHMGEVLVKDKDYSLTYTKNEMAGKATITIKGLGAYTGTIKKTFKIEAYDITGETNPYGDTKPGSPLVEAGGLLATADCDLVVKHLKGGCMPQLCLLFHGKELVSGKDYTVTYKNNKAVYEKKPGYGDGDLSDAPAIIIKGKGNFKGTITKLFNIRHKAVGDGVRIEVSDKVANGKKGGYISKPVLIDEDGKKLVEGKDYNISVYHLLGDTDVTVLGKKDVVEAGEVVGVTISGIDHYNGSEIIDYRITEKDFTKVKATTITKMYNGRQVELDPSDFGSDSNSIRITAKDGTLLHYGADFEIVEGSYQKNDKKGTATVTLKGLGEYGGTKKIKFKIVSRELRK